MTRLLEADLAQDFATFHMGGHWDPDGLDMARAIRRVLDALDLPCRSFPWRLIRLIRLLLPVAPLFR